MTHPEQENHEDQTAARVDDARAVAPGDRRGDADAVPALTDSTPLGEARRATMARLNEGTDCPCCARRVKAYDRPLTSVMARGLRALWRVHRREYGDFAAVIREHLADVASQGGYLSMTQHWGLMEADPDRGGYWRVTPRGEAWLHGRTTVHERARLFDGRCLAHLGPQITVQDALGTHFDPADVLAAAPVPTADTLPLFDLSAAA